VIRLIAGPDSRIEDAALGDGCEYGQRVVDGVTRWAVWGREDLVRDLVERLNDDGLLDSVGVGADPFLSVEHEGEEPSKCVLSQFVIDNRDDAFACAEVSALKVGGSFNFGSCTVRRVL
jgi:hypothetical protein